MGTPGFNWRDALQTGSQALAGASGNQQLYDQIQQQRDQKKQQADAMRQASLTKIGLAQQKVNSMLASGTHPETGAPLSDIERGNLTQAQQSLNAYAHQIATGQPPPKQSAPPAAATSPGGSPPTPQQPAQAPEALVGQYTADVPANPYAQKYNQVRQAFPNIEPEEAMHMALGTTPKTLQDKLIAQWEKDGLTPEQALQKYTDITKPKTDKPAIPEIKPVEGGLGVETPATGSVYLMSQADDPSTPPKVRDALHQIQANVKAKQDASDKRERDSDERQMRSLAAIAGRMGQSEQFQEGMTNYRSQLGEWKAIDQKAKDAQADYEMQAGASRIPGNKSAFDQALIGEYARLSVPGARVTQNERQWAMQMGSLLQRGKISYQKAASGELPDNIRQQYIQFLKSRADSMRGEADEAKPDPPAIATGGKKKAAPASNSKDPLGVL